MNFVIIEDNKVHLESALYSFFSAFSCEKNQIDQVDHFIEKVDITPESVSNFFHKNFVCYDIKWIKSCGCAIQDIKSGAAIREWDVVIIDLNLEENFENYLCPNIKANEAGFHICLQLLLGGFPQERICFLTANSSEVAKFNSKFKDIGLEKEIVNINKSDVDEKLIPWIKKHHHNKRLLLRRAVAEGCEEIRNITKEKGSDVIKINKFIQLQENKLTVKDVETWLEIMPRICSIDGDLDLPLILFMLYYWDGKPGPNADIKQTHNLLAYSRYINIPDTF